MNEDKPCGGGVEYDADGNYVRRYACEVHLFDPGVCRWQQTMQDERNERRKQ